VSIRKAEPKDREQLEKLAEKYIAPLYGNQRKAIDGWVTGSNFKHAWVYDNENGLIKGLVAVSDKPDKNYVKLSTLVVEKGLRKKGIGSKLFEKAMEHFKNSRKEEMSVTVSEEKQDVIGFLEKKGFNLKAMLIGRYVPGEKELIYVLKVK